eukprot:m.336375 g.336375  ORF g.336375 m.336375 type:complete len:628 (-) comp20534_c0_seq3:562-2445(-)
MAAVETALDIDADAVKFCEVLKELQGHSESRHAVFNEEFSITVVPANIPHPIRMSTGKTEPFFIVTKATTSTSEEPTSTEEHASTLVPPAVAPASNRDVVAEIEALTASVGCAQTMDPIDMDDARYLMSLYLVATESNTTGERECGRWWPVLMACRTIDGETEQHTIMGVERHTNGDIESHRIPLPIKQPPVSKKECDSIRDAIDSYTKKFRLRPETKICTSAAAVYDILGSPDCFDSSSLSVYFYWKSPAAMFTPPPYSANALMRARAVPGDSKSPAHWLLQDVTTLQQLASIAHDIHNDQRWHAGPAVVDQTESFLDRIKSDACFPQSAPCPVGGSGESVSTLSRRTDLDFTEHLWEFCKTANSFADLRSILAVVFRALQTGQVQPMIHKTNHTRIGAVARGCLLASTGTGTPTTAATLRDDMQQLADPTQLVLAVAELGVSKLRRDYSAYFLGEEMSTSSQLAFYFNDNVALDDKVERIGRLHCLLEVLLLAKGYGDIPHANLRQLFRDGVEYYTTHAKDSLPFFELSFPAFSESASKVKRLCGTMDPAKWNLNLSHDNASAANSSSIATKNASSMAVLHSTVKESFGVVTPEESSLPSCLYSSVDFNDTAFFTTISSREICVS